MKNGNPTGNPNGKTLSFPPQAAVPVADTRATHVPAPEMLWFIPKAAAVIAV